MAVTQTLLPLTPQNACHYTNTPFPRDLYRLKPDSIAERCALILKNTGTAQNFELVASNVASVTAVVDSAGKRWLLYSRRHFMNQTDAGYRVLALAHEIGHHVNEHTLTPENREAEEVEADEFAGFALYRMGIARQQVLSAVAQSPGNNGLDSSEHRAAVLRGFERGEASVLVAPHAAFNDDGSGNAIPGIPEFPFPPPQASATYLLDDFFGDCKTLSEVEKRLNKSLKDNGYCERRYFYVKGGFALVTRLEQINPEGYSLSVNRWNPKPVREETFSWASYLKSLVIAQPGYFRVFAFLITDQPLTLKGERQVTRPEAEAWLSQGCFKLPPAIGQLKYTPNTTIVALVYEFQVPESTRKPALSQPSTLSGEMHLQRAKIAASLK